jgi:hypothetical protein
MRISLTQSIPGDQPGAVTTASLRHELADLEVPDLLSPELALVDPELAGVARAHLPPAPDCLAPRPTEPAATVELLAPSRADQAWLDRIRHAELDRHAREKAEREAPTGSTGLVAGTAAFVLIAVAGLFAGSRAWHALRPASHDFGVAAIAPTTIATTVGPVPASGRPATTAAAPDRTSRPSATARARASVTRTAGGKTGARRTPVARRGVAAARVIRSVTPRVHVFVWPRVPGARFYRLSIFRARTKILEAAAKAPRFALRSRWRFRRRTFVLSPGIYVWIVRPAQGSARAPRYGPAVTHSTWRVRTGA